MSLLKLNFVYFRVARSVRVLLASLGIVMMVLGVFVFGNSLTYNVLDEIGVNV